MLKMPEILVEFLHAAQLPKRCGKPEGQLKPEGLSLIQVLLLQPALLLSFFVYC